MNKTIIDLNPYEINMVSGGDIKDLSDKAMAYIGAGAGGIVVMIGLVICLCAQPVRPSFRPWFIVKFKIRKNLIWPW